MRRRTEMNKVCQLCVCLLLLPPLLYAAESGDRERTFLKALETFDAAKTPDDFRNVAVAFESLLGPEYSNDAVYYNIGNARVKSGEYGKAILAYRKAKFYRPRDPWLEANLRQTLTGAPGRLQNEPQPWWRSVIFWSEWLSYSEKFNLVLVAWVLSVLAFSSGLIWRKPRLNWAGWVIAGLALLFSLDAYLAYNDLNNSNRAVVVTETVARKGNGLNWEQAFDQPLKDGAEFSVIEKRADWIFGHFHGIGDAWLPAKNVAEY